MEPLNIKNIEEALKRLGGKGSMKEIYHEVEKIRGNENLSRTFDKTINRLLQNYSSDCKNYLGREDIFYQINGNAGGVWGLRHHTPAKQKKLRNPIWSRDELILVLNCYLNHYPKIPGKKSDEVIELSILLNDLANKLSGVTSSTFRNVNGVYMKMMNFHSINPNHVGSGLKAGAKLDQMIWNEFSNDKKKLSKVSSAIHNAIKVEGLFKAVVGNEDATEQDAQEGRLLTRVHKYYERDPKLVKKKKDKVFFDTGKLECECCGFDFYKIYGQRGEYFIECHHKNPVSEINQGQKTKLSDLALVCSNCHRMIHRFRPWLSIAQLQIIIHSKNA